jgi:hypothetical protein
MHGYPTATIFGNQDHSFPNESSEAPISIGRTWRSTTLFIVYPSSFGNPFLLR